MEVQCQQVKGIRFIEIRFTLILPEYRVVSLEDWPAVTARLQYFTEHTIY